jgi:hypothetical protein
MFTRLSRRFIFAAALLASGLSAADTQEKGRPDKLVVGLLPGESAPTVMRLNEPLRVCLEKRLGIPVELAVWRGVRSAPLRRCAADDPATGAGRDAAGFQPMDPMGQAAA